MDLLEEEASETPDAAPESTPERVRGRKEGDRVNPPLVGLTLKAPVVPVLGKVVRTLLVGGRTKRSTTVDGGDRGKAVRRGRLPGGEVESSRCCFLIKVGVNSGPSSSDKNREESSDSRSSNRKWGWVR